MKKTTIINSTIILAATLAIAGCGKSGSSGTSSSSGSSGQTALSVKYQSGDSAIIFTKSADGNKMRMDMIHKHDDHLHQSVQIMDRRGGPNKSGIFYIYEDGTWTELLRSEGDSVNMKAISVEQRINNAFADTVSDLTKYYLQERIGFTKQPAQTVAGKSCDVYAGVYPKEIQGIAPPRYNAFNMSGAHEEIAVWNGITMRLKYTTTNSKGVKTEKVPLEAQAITTSVPDSAFTKTLETPWIK